MKISLSGWCLDSRLCGEYGLGEEGLRAWWHEVHVLNSFGGGRSEMSFARHGSMYGSLLFGTFSIKKTIEHNSIVARSCANLDTNMPTCSCLPLRNGRG